MLLPVLAVAAWPAWPADGLVCPDLPHDSRSSLPRADSPAMLETIVTT
jgi:hypothetical protein